MDEQMALRSQVPDFDPFQAMDKLDDEAILAELEGRVVDTWVYHFPQEGKEIWGVSKVGIDQACREMAKQGEAIREEDVLWSIDPTDKEYVLFKASASRIAVTKDGKEIPLDRAMGTKRQSVNTVRRDGKTAPNPFWFEQGSIKALRNARARLVSEETRSKIIALAKEKGKVREVKKPDQTPKDIPGMLTIKGAEQIRDMMIQMGYQKKTILQMLSLRAKRELTKLTDLTEDEAKLFVTELETEFANAAKEKIDADDPI